MQGDMLYTTVPVWRLEEREGEGREGRRERRGKRGEKERNRADGERGWR
jgi:hypothetical protein